MLQGTDLFENGVVAVAQASDFPQVIVEHVYPADASAESELQKMLTKGLEVKLQKTLDLSAIIHVEKLDGGRMQITVVPLTYGTYTLREGNGSFSLNPPDNLHLAGGLPIVKGDELQKALATAVSPQGTPAIALDLNADNSQPQKLRDASRPFAGSRQYSGPSRYADADCSSDTGCHSHARAHCPGDADAAAAGSDCYAAAARDECDPDADSRASARDARADAADCHGDPDSATDHRFRRRFKTLPRRRQHSAGGHHCAWKLAHLTPARCHAGASWMCKMRAVWPIMA
ncbi:MAG: hypothetical protein QM796_09870 [Chthoniobacteraceae bacterium]